jgi:hypothetical protein
VASASGNGSTTATINLTGVATGQTIVLKLTGVTDGSAINDIALSMSVLVGDTSWNGMVSASDVTQTKGQVAQPVTTSNFRADVNANGSINASDVSLVKSQTGTSLPPAIPATVTKH